jgi:hypothetical protein
MHGGMIERRLMAKAPEETPRPDAAQEMFRSKGIQRSIAKDRIAPRFYLYPSLAKEHKQPQRWTAHPTEDHFMPPTDPKLKIDPRQLS